MTIDSPRTVDGLQTRGIFALHCTIEPSTITIGRLWVRDLGWLGQEVSLVQSDGDDRFVVRMPEDLPENPADKVVLRRVPTL